jgi:predicted HicB family RNase H-like nuclease
MNTMTHDGYIAEISLDEETGLLAGIVLNTRATLHFAGKTIEELKAGFADTIDDYRNWCRAEGKEPEKPYSGTLSLRIAPDLHRRIAGKAAREGRSINAVIGEALERVA